MMRLQGAGQSTAGTRERLYYLDWLKILSVLVVFYAHSIDALNFVDRKVEYAIHSTGILIFTTSGSRWGMSFFFLLAGAGAWFALSSRTVRQFLSERFQRLVLPFLVGVFLLAVPQAYFQALSSANYRGSFLAFYPYFFNSIQFSWRPGWLAAIGYHLWFLPALFMITMLALPLLLILRHESSRRLIASISTWCERPVGMLLFALPIILIQVALQAPFPGYQGWTDFFSWLVFFLYGYILASNPHFEHAIKQQSWYILGVLLLCLLVMVLAYNAGLLQVWENTTSYTPGYVLYQTLRGLASWALTIFLLFFGIRCLDADSRVLHYANQAALPFYIVHYAIIALVAYVILPWPLPLIAQFLLISTGALILTLVLYELLIRRSWFMRRVFGMPSEHKTGDKRPHQKAIV